MTGAPLRIRIFPASEIDQSEVGSLILRSGALIGYLPEPPGDRLVTLDELLYPDGEFNPDWRDGLLHFMHEHAREGSIRYGVYGDPLSGDLTVQHLLSRHGERDIAVDIERSTSPMALERRIAMFPVPHVYVDSITLLEIADASPFSGGALPLSSNQTTILTNLVGPAIAPTKRVLQRRYGSDLEMHTAGVRGDGDERRVRLEELDADGVEPGSCLVVPAATGDQFYRSPDDLQRLVARLRAPDGCPWDRKQTNASLTRNLIEESYELLEAIESGDVIGMREEMGDFILQAYLHCQIAEEAQRFTLEDALDTLIAKLVRRHPHVFASTSAEDADHVVRNWDEIKRAERAEKPDSTNGGPLGNVPVSLPALARAQTLLKRARRMDLASSDVDRRRDDALERASVSTGDAEALRGVLATVERSAAHGIDAEEVLRRWTREFERSFDATGAQTDEVTRP